MPDAVLADHLLSSIDGVAAATAALTRGGLGAGVRPGVAVDEGGSAVRRNKGGGVAVAEALGPEEPAVARATVDLAVRTVAGQSRVQRTMAFGAVEAFLVPHLEEKNERSYKSKNLESSCV